MTVCYRLYTEVRPNLLPLVSSYFNAATIFYAEGIWNGSPEQTAVIEIIGDLVDLTKIELLADDIRTTNAQTSVLLTATAITARMVGA